MTFRAMSEREIDICSASYNGWVTRAQIAKALRLSKHPALMKAIEDMVADGMLERRLSETNKGTPIYYYRTKEDSE